MSRHGHGIGFHRTNGTIRQVRLCELLVVPEPHPENRHGDGQGRGRTDHRHTPTSLVMDKYNKMWTITDGGYEGSPYGYEAPSLYRIDAETFTVEKQFKFKLGDWPSEVQLNGTRDILYWINNDIWRMPVEATVFPSGLFWSFGTPNTTALRSIPTTGRYMWPTLLIIQQQGIVYRYSRKAS